MEVGDGEVPRANVCSASAEVDVDWGCERQSPEQPVRVRGYSRVEIMDLGAEIREVIQTSIEVQSDKDERTLVDFSVHAHVDATHEAHIGVEEERFRAAIGIRPGPVPLDVRDSDSALEVSDR